MNWFLVYDFFAKRLVESNLDGIDKNSIATPNQIFNSVGKPVWIELSAFVGNAVRRTEMDKFVHASLNAIVCVPRESSMTKASVIASKVARVFSEKDNKNFFSGTVEGVKFRCYCSNANVLSGVTDSSGYRINVRISLDIYLEN